MPMILVVDDTATARAALIKLLRQEGYETEAACNGREALARLERPAARRPDLVLLDIAMPELDGLDVLESLKGDAQWKSLPVIMLTGECDTHCIRRAEQLGAKDYFVKATFSIAQMLEQVDRYTRPLCN